MSPAIPQFALKKLVENKNVLVSRRRDERKIANHQFLQGFDNSLEGVPSSDDAFGGIQNDSKSSES